MAAGDWNWVAYTGAGAGLLLVGGLIVAASKKESPPSATTGSTPPNVTMLSVEIESGRTYEVFDSSGRKVASLPQPGCSPRSAQGFAAAYDAGLLPKSATFARAGLRPRMGGSLPAPPPEAASVCGEVYLPFGRYDVIRNGINGSPSDHVSVNLTAGTVAPMVTASMFANAAGQNAPPTTGQRQPPSGNLGNVGDGIVDLLGGGRDVGVGGKKPSSGRGKAPGREAELRCGPDSFKASDAPAQPAGACPAVLSSERQADGLDGVDLGMVPACTPVWAMMKLTGAKEGSHGGSFYRVSWYDTVSHEIAEGTMELLPSEISSGCTPSWAPPNRTGGLGLFGDGPIVTVVGGRKPGRQAAQTGDANTHDLLGGGLVDLLGGGDDGDSGGSPRESRFGRNIRSRLRGDNVATGDVVSDDGVVVAEEDEEGKIAVEPVGDGTNTFDVLGDGLLDMSFGGGRADRFGRNVRQRASGGATPTGEIVNADGNVTVVADSDEDGFVATGEAEGEWEGSCAYTSATAVPFYAPETANDTSVLPEGELQAGVPFTIVGRYDDGFYGQDGTLGKYQIAQRATARSRGFLAAGGETSWNVVGKVAFLPIASVNAQATCGRLHLGPVDV